MIHPSWATLNWTQLETRVIQPDSTTLIRLYRHAGSEWDPVPPQYRNLRVDPPAPHKDLYSVLYTSPRIDTVAQECNVLQATDEQGKWTINEDREAAYFVARYTFTRGGIFIPLDGSNGRMLGLEDVINFGDYDTFQQLGKVMFEKFGHFAHGLCWRSFHRHNTAYVYAIWHNQKESLGLARPTTGPLPTDSEWVACKKLIPTLVAIRS